MNWNLASVGDCSTDYIPGQVAPKICFLDRYGGNTNIGANQFGAQLMVSSGYMNNELAIARLSNVELFYVGQGYRRSRHPIHFHLNGDMASSYVKECAIHNSFNRAINVRACNRLTIESNVVFNIRGSSFQLQDSVEVGNTFRNNLAVLVQPSLALVNEDFTPGTLIVS